MDFGKDIEIKDELDKVTSKIEDFGLSNSEIFWPIFIKFFIKTFHSNLYSTRIDPGNFRCSIRIYTYNNEVSIIYDIEIMFQNSKFGVVTIFNRSFIGDNSKIGSFSFSYKESIPEDIISWIEFRSAVCFKYEVDSVFLSRVLTPNLESFENFMKILKNNEFHFWNNDTFF